jgi:hypothetical protein
MTTFVLGCKNEMKTNNDGPMQQSEMQDEDLRNEIANDGNMIAKVTLPSSICK